MTRSLTDRRVEVLYYSPSTATDVYTLDSQRGDSVQVMPDLLSTIGVPQPRVGLDWHGAFRLLVNADGLEVGLPLGVYTAGPPASWDVCDATLVLYDAFTGVFSREFTLTVAADQTTNPGLIDFAIADTVDPALDPGTYSWELVIDWPAPISATTVEARGVIRFEPGVPS